MRSCIVYVDRLLTSAKRSRSPGSIRTLQDGDHLASVCLFHSLPVGGTSYGNVHEAVRVQDRDSCRSGFVFDR